MPAPEKTSRERIVAAGREILEADGPQGLTMQRVAQRVGVRAPSLYKHVRDRAALLSAVAESGADDLRERLDATDGSLDELLRAYREFAHRRPEAFRLFLTAAAPPRALERASAPVLRAAAGLAGEDDALEAARLAVAWITGFLQMELGGAFRLGGDLDRAFEYGLARVRRAVDEGPSGAF